MNIARIKLLISDLRAAEKEILLSRQGDDYKELMNELKTAIDDFRLSVWCSITDVKNAENSQQYLQSVRMNRVVEMLRQIKRDKGSKNQEAPFTFADLVRVAEEAITQSCAKPN
jgi:hypothetical protein